MYSDSYRGSYHLRSLTEAEILSSRHYRRMTSAPRHGSNYIIQAHNTPAARQHQRPSRSPLSPVVLSALLQFLVFTLLLLLHFFFLTSTQTHHHHHFVCSFCRTGICSQLNILQQNIFTSVAGVTLVKEV